MKSRYTDSRACGSNSLLFRVVSPCLCAVVTAGTIGAVPVQVRAQEANKPALSGGPAASQDLREAARSYLTTGDYDRAIECYLAIIAQRPNDAISLKADLGLCYKCKRDYSKAMQLFAEVGAVAGPRQPEVLYWADDSYCEQGKMAEAVDHLSRMYQQHPKLREQVLGRRLDRLDALGRTKEAIADLKELITKYPENEHTSAHKVRLAGLLLRSGGLTPAFDAALESANTAVTSERNPETARNLGKQLDSLYLAIEDALWAKGAKSDAVDYLKRLYVERPDSGPDVLMRLSLRHELLGKAQEAADCLCGFVTTFPNDARARMAAVKATEFTLRAKGDCKESQELIEWALNTVGASEVDPAEAKSLKNELGLALIRTGQFAKAEQILKSLLRDYPNDAQLQLSLGEVYRGIAQYDKAMPLIQSATENGQGQVQIGAIQRYEDCLTDQEKCREAVEYLAAKYREHPEYGASLLTKRADRLTFKISDYQEAIADYQELVSNFPETPEARSAELAIAHLTALGLRDIAAGDALLRNYIKKYPNDPQVIAAYHHLGSLYCLEGKYADAIKVLAEGIKCPDPGNYSAVMMYLLVDCYKRMGLSEDAAKTAGRLVDTFRNDDWTKLMMIEHPDYAGLLK